MCGGRLKGSAGSSESISTSRSLTDSGERGVGPASGSWISMSELRRIIIWLARVRRGADKAKKGGRGSTDKRLEEAVIVHR